MIRFAKEEDISDIMLLLKQVHQVHSNIRPDLFKSGMTKYNDEEVKKIINNPDTPVFVYVEDNHVSGYAFTIIEKTDSASLVSHKTLYIDDLCVDENQRRKGIATKLYHYVCDYAKQNGFYHITLNVWEGNKDALAFYKSLGMKTLKTTLETILK